MESIVYRASTQEEIDLLRGAEIVRVKLGRPNGFFPLEYYQTHIADLLFPNAVVTYRGVRYDETPGQPYSFIYYLSKMAKIPKDHAVYSAHMTDDLGDKRSICSCQACATHRASHLYIDEKAYQVAQGLEKAGIGVPWYDPSDYCLDQSTNTIRFFEIDEFDSAKLRNYLHSLDMPDYLKRRVNRLLGRYEAIMNRKKPMLYDAEIPISILQD
ncbi:MAG: hypothetical protein US54_C0010G0015 [Candidatus Roizmanbacteria bacterium GW2011_GWA2_37_7]|uniref:Uncharacterized protein n=1 Tax=Candidatus Roizmanbacteria bacterium GW2011_GWA2_37_7 TaxID=1618481 RepID=A0A0G0JNF3_9BACT|nr:MAG: hypothetical protein US54_C0010G0015 [Candidatus Roizmanbacteria bacterium GW2011_GWA2_37_7]